MRNYKNFVRPYGDLKKIREALDRYYVRHGIDKSELYGNWRQHLITDLFEKAEAQKLRERWMRAVSQAVGTTFKQEEFSFVLHTGKEPVESHTDRMAKTSFLVPLRASSTLKFYENWSSVLMQDVQLLRFNDFNQHGLENPHSGGFEILSISRDVNWNSWE